MFWRHEAKQPEGLISVLLDESAEFGDRHDAAMDVAAYDEPAAEAALLRIALNRSAEEGLADACGESLWEIWSRKGAQDNATIAKLHPSARKFFEVNDG